MKIKHFLLFVIVLTNFLTLVTPSLVYSSEPKLSYSANLPSKKVEVNEILYYSAQITNNTPDIQIINAMPIGYHDPYAFWDLELIESSINTDFTTNIHTTNDWTDFLFGLNLEIQPGQTKNLSFQLKVLKVPSNDYKLSITMSFQELVYNDSVSKDFHSEIWAHETPTYPPLSPAQPDNLEVNQNTTTSTTLPTEIDLQITLPDDLIVPGSTTTRIDQFTNEQLKSIPNFTIELVGKNKVVFKNPLDFSDTVTIELLNKLTDYIDIDTLGKVGIDSQNLPFFNSPATIYMYGLPFENTPLIYKDGKLVTNEEVSNIVYIYSLSKGGTLQFDVASFSTYEAKAAEISQLDQEYKIPGEFSTLRIVIIIFLVTIEGIVVAVIVKRIERKRQNQKTE